MERRESVEMNNQPLVSVPVITYNSSKFVLETLESIKAQTYQNIELIISDDCSTDNTVELCQEWVEQNNDRFVRTQIITSEMNTGISANLNRAEAACQGEWVKGIAGDDVLMPSCIDECLDYVTQHPKITYLFGRIEAFGASEERNKYFTENIFDYSFFNMDVKGQLQRLVFDSNCVPAVTCFYNRKKSIELGIKNDERIPLLEDWPKWINILEKKVKLEFMNKIVVKYRIHKKSLSTNLFSINFYQSNFLFALYYLYPRWKERGEDYAIKRLVADHLECFTELYQSQQYEKKQREQILNSYAYRVGRFIVRPIGLLKKIIMGK